MRKRKEKAMRRLMALLAAICILGNMPYMALTASAEETVSGNELILEQSEEENEDQAQTSDSESGIVDAEETDDSGDDEEDTSDESGDEETEEPDKEEDKETEGPENTDTENPEEEPENETDVEDFEAEEDAESEETDPTDELEDEDSEESVMLLSAEDEINTVAEQQTDSVYTDGKGIKYHYYGYDDGTANIYELEDFLDTYPKGKAINIPKSIGGYTVTQITFTMSQSYSFPTVTIPETVTYIENLAFRFATINQLYYNAVDATAGSGSFTRATIKELYIGKNVKVIPDYLFSNATITLDELTLDVEKIGKNAFYRYTTVTNLTIGENVKEIGSDAFGFDDITNVYFNAIECKSASQSEIFSPFNLGSVSSITFGDKVTVIPKCLLANISFTTDKLEIPESVTEIGANAFYGMGTQIGEVTIAENITTIGQEAFGLGSIGKLYYNAIDAEIPGMQVSLHHRNPFGRTDIGELYIGDKVKVLPDSMFFQIKLAQDELIIPDSVTYVGYDVLSYANDVYASGKITIGKLVIGENVAHIGRAAFGAASFDKVVIYAVETGNELLPYYMEVPTCGSVEIHRNSDCYDFFTKNTEADNITLLCEDFETTYGDEYFDEDTSTFVTQVTDTCTVCGYEVESEESVDGYTVIFEDYDGRELSKQHVKSGADATEPKEPERTGYDFTGWDKSYKGITSNVTVRAQYKIKTFHVEFKDGDKTISDQEIDYGGSAKVPEDPTRPSEEWGSWKFTGWEGNYENVTKDEVVQAQFEKVMNKYEVIFYDADGKVLSRQTITHGEAAKTPEAPEKESTPQYSYTFKGWDGDTDNITGNISFHPTYESKIRSYTVTFLNGSDEVDKQTVEYGGSAKVPEDPTRPAEEWGTWKFTGWKGTYENIEKDEIVRAQFEKIMNEYEVIFYDADGEELSRQTVTHGEAAELPEAPKKESTPQYSYTFKGWDGDTDNITGNVSFYPVYESKTRTYTVTFMNGNKVVDKQTVEYGKGAATPTDPVKAADDKYTYTFIGWEGDYDFITEDTVIYAMFEEHEIPETEDKGNGGESEQEKPEPGDQGGGTTPSDGGEPNQETDGRTEPGSPDTGTDGNGEDNSVEPEISIVEQLFQSAMRAPDTSDRVSDDTTAVTDEEPEEIPEECEESDIVENAVDTSDMDDTNDTDDTETIPDKGETGRDNGWLTWLMLLLGMIASGAFLIWLYLILRNRKVYGIILNEDGSPMCGAKITMIGKDMPETETDENGCFCMDGLKKDDYRLKVTHNEGYLMLSVDIFMESEDKEETFSILESYCSSVETKEKNRKYEINVTA